MEAFRFYSWYWLLFIPVLVAVYLARSWTFAKPSATFSSLQGLQGLPVTLAQRVHRLLPWLYLLGLALLLLGLARPQAGKSESRISGEGIAIELVLDISGSMEALDFQIDDQEVNRLTAVKQVISEFVLGSKKNRLSGRKDDAIGLVAFGGFADSKCPLTLDHGALIQIVKELEVPKPVRDKRGRVINERSLQEELATAIGDGVALGVDRLRGSKAKSKVLILLTDGDNNAGAVEPMEAVAIAKELGIRVYTVGIGRNGTVPVPQEDEFGRKVLVPAQFRIDEELLRQMAKEGDGVYFHASNSESLTEVYSQIDQLEKTELEETKYAEYTELYPWLIGAGLMMIGLVGVLKETRLRSLP